MQNEVEELRKESERLKHLVNSLARSALITDWILLSILEDDDPNTELLKSAHTHLESAIRKALAEDPNLSPELRELGIARGIFDRGSKS